MQNPRIFPLSAIRYSLYATLLIFNLSGCASVVVTQPPPKPQGIAGIYHRAQKGQTLWRISRIYNVDLDELVRVNRLYDTANIRIGQMIFIPGPQKQQVDTGRLAVEEFSWPIKGKVIACYGQITNNMVNKGVDIKPERSLNVIASRCGRVIFYSPKFSGFGKTIIIDHGDGFSSVYARNSEVFVKTGDFVYKGMTIAKAGYAGRDKNVYLHFELRKNHLAQNPYFYLP